MLAVYFTARYTISDPVDIAVLVQSVQYYHTIKITQAANGNA